MLSIPSWLCKNTISESQWVIRINYCLFCQWTPMHVAAKEGRKSTVECLVKKGAKINIEDKDGVSIIILVIVASTAN